MQDVWSGILLEFSDLPSIEGITRLAVRLLLALLLGGLIGYERERSGKSAGFRTHMVVCLGTAFFVAVPAQAGMTMEGLSRIIQGVAAGIGFIGAGCILKIEQEGRIEGLTTAASVWFTAAIGIAVGMGRDASAVLAAVLALVILKRVGIAGQERGGR